MSNSSTLKVAPGFILVVPEKKSEYAGGMIVGRGQDPELPRGTVHAVGGWPADQCNVKAWQMILHVLSFGAISFPPMRIQPGDTVVYARVVAADLPALPDGTAVKAIRYADVRALFTNTNSDDDQSPADG